jgi:hypothetical protein
MHMVFLSFFSKFQFSGQKQQSGLRAGKKNRLCLGELDLVESSRGKFKLDFRIGCALT